MENNKDNQEYEFSLTIANDNNTREYELKNLKNNKCHVYRIGELVAEYATESLVDPVGVELFKYANYNHFKSIFNLPRKREYWLSKQIYDVGTNQLTYFFENEFTLLIFDFVQMKKIGIDIKRCENCGKYFVPETRSDEIYCNNIFKGNRTCRQIGYENKVNGNEVLREYRKIYKTQNARKQRNKDNIQGLEQRFSDWSAYAKEQLVKCQNGEITLAEMRANISPTDWMKGGD